MIPLLSVAIVLALSAPPPEEVKLLSTALELQASEELHTLKTRARLKDLPEVSLELIAAGNVSEALELSPTSLSVAFSALDHVLTSSPFSLTAVSSLIHAAGAAFAHPESFQLLLFLVAFGASASLLVGSFVLLFTTMVERRNVLFYLGRQLSRAVRLEHAGTLLAILLVSTGLLFFRPADFLVLLLALLLAISTPPIQNGLRAAVALLIALPVMIHLLVAIAVPLERPWLDIELVRKGFHRVNRHTPIWEYAEPNTAILFTRAVLLSHWNQGTSADSLYQQIRTDHAPTQLAILNNRAALALRSRRFDESRALLDDVLKQDPKNVYGLVNRSLLEMSNVNLPEADRFLTAAKNENAALVSQLFRDPPKGSAPVIPAFHPLPHSDPDSMAIASFSARRAKERVLALWHQWGSALPPLYFPLLVAAAAFLGLLIQSRFSTHRVIPCASCGHLIRPIDRTNPSQICTTCLNIDASERMLDQHRREEKLRDRHFYQLELVWTQWMLQIFFPGVYLYRSNRPLTASAVASVWTLWSAVSIMALSLVWIFSDRWLRPVGIIAILVALAGWAAIAALAFALDREREERNRVS